MTKIHRLLPFLALVLAGRIDGDYVRVVYLRAGACLADEPFLALLADELRDALALAGCAETQRQVRSDYDRTANFNAYRTFDFYTDAGRSPTGGDYSTLIAQRIEAAIEREMVARGYVRAQNPDLLVNFRVTVKNVDAPGAKSYSQAERSVPR